MDLEELSLKATSLLRRAGLTDVSRQALAGVVMIGLVLTAVACWHFWPRDSQDFVATSSSASTSQEQLAAEQADAAHADPVGDIVVDVEGAVANPGLRCLPSGSRIGDAVEAAGGLSADAAIGSVNLAQVVEDGDQIIIRTKDEVAQSQNAAEADDGSGSSSSNVASEISSSNKNGKININTASATELQKLSGVGPSLSERIVQYREANGRFRSIDELRNVSGIGETRFANIKDMICI